MMNTLLFFQQSFALLYNLVGDNYGPSYGKDSIKWILLSKMVSWRYDW